MRLAVIDCGMGNLRSVVKALEFVGFEEVKTVSVPEEIKRADAVVFPGQGAFRKAMENLYRLGLVEPILESIREGKPFLGICLGLQLLFDRSEEHGISDGLGVLRGEVRLLPRGVKLPHIGWNQIEKQKDSALFESIKDGDFFYFVHSYRVVPEDRGVVATITEYGEPFVSAVEKDNIMAVQFHPEKSQKKGLRLLENFRRLLRRL